MVDISFFPLFLFGYFFFPFPRPYANTASAAVSSSLGWSAVLNNITTRVLLCGPCNLTKSNIYTLSGLRRKNKKNTWMAKD